MTTSDVTLPFYPLFRRPNSGGVRVSCRPVSCTAFAGDEGLNVRYQLRRHNHDSLVLRGQGRFDVRGLLLLRLLIMMGSQFTDAFFRPTPRQALFFHRFLLLIARR